MGFSNSIMAKFNGKSSVGATLYSRLVLGLGLVLEWGSYLGLLLELGLWLGLF